MDKSWIDLKHRATTAYVQGCDAFLDFAFSNNEGRKHIYCPCKKCQNRYYVTREIAREHIICDGFNTHYRIWAYHGERYGEVADENVDSGLCAIEPTSGLKKEPLETKKKSDLGLRKDQPSGGDDNLHNKSGMVILNEEMGLPKTVVEYFGSNERKRKSEENEGKQDGCQGTRRTAIDQVHEKKKKGMPRDAEAHKRKDGEPGDTTSATPLVEQAQLQSSLSSCSCVDLMERVQKVEERNREITEEMRQMREMICALTNEIPDTSNSRKV